MHSSTPFGRHRRTRGYAAVAHAVSPEVRQVRAAMLADTQLRRELAAATSAVEIAREALKAKENLAPERAALEAAMTRLRDIEAAIKNETAPAETKEPAGKAAKR